MKKFFKIFTCALLVLTLVLSLTGCAVPTPLTFNDLFYGVENASPNRNYTETATYKVKYQANYGTDIQKDNNITDSLLTMDITGTYSTKLQVINLGDMASELESSELLGVKINSNLTNVYKDKIYKFTTKLDLTSKYTLKGEAKDDQTDYIYSVSYFAPAKMGFAPIFTEQDLSYSAIMVTDNGVTLGRYTNKCYATYNQDGYSMKKQHFDADGQLLKTETNSYESVSGTVVDNAQFLFVLRNIQLIEKQMYDLGVVSYQYGESQTLRITCESIREEFIPTESPLTVNGVPYVDNDPAEAVEKIKLCRYAYRLAQTTQAGLQQFVYVQEGNYGNLGNRRFMYRYVEPLSAFGSSSTLGVLVYTLDSVTFNG